MDKIKYLMVISFLAITSTIYCQNKNTPPEWFNNSPKIKGSIVATGIGETKYDALTSALNVIAAELENKINYIKKSYVDDTTLDTITTNSSKIVSQRRFGSIMYSSTSRKIIEYTQRSEIYDTFSIEQTLMFIKDQDTISFKVNSASKNESDKDIIEKTLSITKGKLLFSDIILELEKNNISVQISDTEDACYVQVIYPKQ